MDVTPDQVLRALADETRLRCLLLMQQEGELCVCELTHALGIIQPKVSRHLATLRQAGIVADRRQGQWIYYRLHPELPGWARIVVAGAAEGAHYREPFASDRRTLADMPNRPGSRCCA